MPAQLRPLLARALLLLAALGFAAPAAAAVEIAFHSRELGPGHFPHALVTLHGRLDATGERVDAAFGFTARSIGPSLLFGAVAGEVIEEDAGRVADSDRQFALVLDDEAYRRVMGVVDAWRSAPQPSYHLDRRNCVHFVAAVARAAGLAVVPAPRLMKRPRSFLRALLRLNPRVREREAGAGEAATGRHP